MGAHGTSRTQREVPKGRKELGHSLPLSPLSGPPVVRATESMGSRPWLHRFFPSGLGAYAEMLRSGPEWLRILAAHSKTWLESQQVPSKPAAENRDADST